MAGFITKDRYTCATVFVDQNINLSYVHFQKSTSSKYTLEAKEAFESFRVGSTSSERSDEGNSTS